MSNPNKWDTLQEDLIRVIIENEDKPKEERKTNKKLFKDFAEVNNTTEASTSFQYYNHIKPKFKPKSLDEKVDKIIKETSLTPAPLYKDYTVGEVIEVTVRGIVDFGVFVTTDNGAEGLIHISQITGREFVTIPDDYFFEGEIVKAKILKFDKNEKLSLSTRAVGGKERINNTFNSLEQAFSKIEIKEEIELAQPSSNVVEEVELVTENPIVNTDKPMISESEKDHVIQFVKSYSGNVSTKALKEIETLLSHHSVFKITLALVETVRDLDTSSFIVELTKERLSGDRLRRTNKRENFSDSSFLRKVE